MKEHEQRLFDELKRFTRFEANVLEWAEKKDLLDPSNSFKQFTKMIEETGEVASALFRQDQDLLEDGIGDIMVTAVILAHQNKLNLMDCCERAWNEIKDRKGKTIDGKFIKQEDLK